ECISAINRKESFLGSLAISIAGTIAPKIFPRCGVPVLCIPVSILDIVLKIFSKGTFFGSLASFKLLLLIIDEIISFNFCRFLSHLVLFNRSTGHYFTFSFSFNKYSEIFLVPLFL